MNIFGKRGQLFWDLHFLVKVDATATIFVRCGSYTAVTATSVEVTERLGQRCSACCPGVSSNAIATVNELM